MTSTVPELLKKVTFPPVPKLTATRFETACPATKLRFDVVGRADAVG